MGQVWAIVVAGGSGSRFGDAVPKQFLDLGGLRLIDWALAAAAAACDGLVAVLPAAHLDAGPVLGARSRTGAPAAAVAGGATRSGSVRAGLAAVPADAEIVVVHDAARPLATPDLFERVIAAVRAGADGAVPGVPVPDTIKRVAPGGRAVSGSSELVDPDGRTGPGGELVAETLDRSTLRAVQTPQAFSAAVLRVAHAAGGEATDDAALVEAAGGRVVIVPGDPTNLKVTGPDDLERAEALLTRRSL